MMDEEIGGENEIAEYAFLRGKTIQSCHIDDNQMNNIIIFDFTDGSSFSLEYDWLYEWKFIDEKCHVISEN